MTPPLTLPEPGQPTPAISELLLLPDGRVLVHNLTPAMAILLAGLDPTDPLMAHRAQAIQSEPPHGARAGLPNPQTQAMGNHQPPTSNDSPPIPTTSPQ